LSLLGVEVIIGISAVGSLDPAVGPGNIAVLSDFIDFTKTRRWTFFDNGSGGVVHADFSHPYCSGVSTALIRAANAANAAIVPRCVYICVEGPRYETPAEIRAFRAWGADVVGMTNVPEVTLAREAGICYGGLAVITNFAAGVSPAPLSHEEVVATMNSMGSTISRIALSAAALCGDSESCACATGSPGIPTIE
jgi:5'-methylthioadenosine phosphorylase